MEFINSFIDSQIPPLIINGGLVVALIYLFFTGKVIPVGTVNIWLEVKESEISRWKEAAQTWEATAKEAIAQNAKLLDGVEMSLHVVESLPKGTTPNPGDRTMEGT